MSTLTGWPPVPPLSGFDLPITSGLNTGLSRLFSPLSLSIVVIVVGGQYFISPRRAKKIGYSLRQPLGFSYSLLSREEI